MGYGAQRRAQRGGWDDLDALVIEEMEALHTRPRERHADATIAATREHERPAPRDGLSEAPDDDEETFIERTVDYLRERPDAEALLDAVRAALNDEEPDLPIEDEAGEAGPDLAADEGPSAPPEAPA